MFFIARSILIALDSKARLVLPLEIRDALGVKKNEKILFSFSAAKNGRVLVKVAKATVVNADNFVTYSKNSAAAKEDRCSL
jgi:bifunctional DNA-binding transcriptional regulator/antitoxin component of YhaV-PrlF toxin-antitoxin module